MKISIRRQIPMAPYNNYSVGVELEGLYDQFEELYKDACATLDELIKRETQWYAAEGSYHAHERLKK